MTIWTRAASGLFLASADPYAAVCGRRGEWVAQFGRVQTTHPTKAAAMRWCERWLGMYRDGVHVAMSAAHHARSDHDHATLP